MTLRDLIPRQKVGREQRGLLPSEHEVRDFVREMFEDFFRPYAIAPRWAMSREMRRFAPALDVTETESEYHVSVELPGMTKNDIQVTVDQGRLIISGEKKSETEEKRKNYVRMERSYGSFTRTVPLPSEIKEAEVEATFREGVLTIRLPKSEEARGKKVQIKTG